jgi:Acyltransferase family
MRDNPTPLPATERNVAVGNLRAFVTLMVIAHHAVLAYHPYAPAPPASLRAEPMLWQAFPIVDSHHWAGIESFVGFNDTYFMSLMFLLSGLFVWPSIERKGAGKFIRDRARRLGVPFVVAAALLGPLAYLPSYLQVNPEHRVAGFWHTWLSLPHWPSGPAWFLWVLLVFDVVAAGLTRIAPAWGQVLSGIAARLQRPGASFWLLVAASVVAYVPLAVALGPGSWATFGPFAFQESRALHYGLYFFVGAGIGAYGLERGLLLPGGALARRWPLWLGSAVGSFFLLVIVFLSALSKGEAAGKVAWALVDFGFVLSCAASSFGFIALFVRFAKPGKLGKSLSENAYGMYLTHYFLVSWLQYLLLPAALPGAIKGTAVFFGVVGLSWGLTAALRRIPAVASFISGSQAPIRQPATSVLG